MIIKGPCSENWPDANEDGPNTCKRRIIQESMENLHKIHLRFRLQGNMNMAQYIKLGKMAQYPYKQKNTMTTFTVNSQSPF